MRTMKLTCTLTQDERLQRADALACLVTERADADEARKEAAKEAREAIEEMDGRIAEYARVVRDGCERRDVEVEDRREGLHLVTHRTDTGEIVESRPLTAAERQETLAPVVRLGREGADGR